MDVTWRIESRGAGTYVVIEHDFRPRLPSFAAFVDRFFTRPIAGQTLATFKAIAETVQSETVDPADARSWANGGGSGSRESAW